MAHINFAFAIALSFSGALGAVLGYRIKVPAGGLAGAIAGVGIGNALLGFPLEEAPPGASQLLQILVGILVGLRVSRSSLRLGVRALVPASLLAVALIVAGLLSALLAANLTSIDLLTAMFAAAPGGITEMSAVGASFGADGASVATVHLTRLLLAIIAVNFIIKFKHFRYRDSRLMSSCVPDTHHPSEEQHGGGYRNLALASTFGIACGLLGLLSPVPAGGIIGALFGSAIVRLNVGNAMPVAKFQLVIQAISGSVIGLGVTDAFLESLVHLAGVGAIIIITQMLLWFAADYLLIRIFHYDELTALFASAPGGMAELVSSSAQAGADTVTVAFVHLVRLSATILVVPTLIIFMLTA